MSRVPLWGDPEERVGQVKVRVGNAGSAPTTAGVPVSAYNGNPITGFPQLATVETSRNLPPGQHEENKASAKTRNNSMICATRSGSHGSTS
jgi:hypothetical protein